MRPWALYGVEGHACPGTVLGQAKGVMAQDAAAQIIDALAMSHLGRRGDALRSALLTAQGLPKSVWATVNSWPGRKTGWWSGCKREHRRKPTKFIKTWSDWPACCSKSTQTENRAWPGRYGGLGAVGRPFVDRLGTGWLDSGAAGWPDAATLMDEFQDTSPLQWQTLRAWLASYVGPVADAVTRTHAGLPGG